MSELKFSQILNVPLIKKGDNIAGILFDSLKKQNITIEDGDILAVTSKIVSKSEGRLVNLTEVRPSEQALKLGLKTKRDPRLVEIILSETKEIIRSTEHTLIVEHNLGFICANAGVDHSNVQGNYGNKEDWYLLLPKAPDHSADIIKDYFKEKSGKNIGVIIIDSHGRPWREGTVGVVIGTSRVPVLVDLRGKPDLFGYHLKITKVAAGDELAAAASLMMGQAAEKIPAIHIRGFPYHLRESGIKEVLRPKKMDLFR
jgi:coenzyme F420-0:L-glutamate ligase / coenzyme F420-1:gamma-L-glutamate ligase